jgi:hypothetical protein
MTTILIIALIIAVPLAVIGFMFIKGVIGYAFRR